MPSYTGYRNFFNSAWYISAINLAATGDTGIIASPLASDGGIAIFPMFFVAVGNNMATDETNDLKIDWYGDLAGNGGILATTTFAQILVGTLTRIEIWPGDVAALYATTREFAPLPAFCKITYTLAGTTKSMGFALYLSYFTCMPL